jgi:hypothetical protein
MSKKVSVIINKTSPKLEIGQHWQNIHDHSVYVVTITPSGRDKVLYSLTDIASGQGLFSESTISSLNSKVQMSEDFAHIDDCNLTLVVPRWKDK